MSSLIFNRLVVLTFIETDVFRIVKCQIPFRGIKKKVNLTILGGGGGKRFNQKNLQIFQHLCEPKALCVINQSRCNIVHIIQPRIPSRSL